MSGTVLIIDDEPFLALSLSLILQSAHYTVATALNAGDGLTLLQSESFDFVFVDLHLPDRYGLDLVPEIFTALPQTTVLIFASNARDETYAHAFQLGVAVCLLKPSDPAEVLQALSDLSHDIPVTVSPNIHPNPNQ